MTTWSDLTTALKRLQTPLLKVIKGRISFKWMGEQESDTPLSSNERVPLLEARHTLDEKCKLQTCLLWEFDYEYCLKYKLNTCYFLNADFKRLVNSIPKNNSVLEMLPTNCQYPWCQRLYFVCQVLYCIWKRILLFQKAEISEVSVHIRRSIQIVCI